jgi:hypothetical protein
MGEKDVEMAGSQREAEQMSCLPHSIGKHMPRPWLNASTFSSPPSWDGGKGEERIQPLDPSKTGEVPKVTGWWESREWGSNSQYPTSEQLSCHTHEVYVNE